MFESVIIGKQSIQPSVALSPLPKVAEGTLNRAKIGTASPTGTTRPTALGEVIPKSNATAESKAGTRPPSASVAPKLIDERKLRPIYDALDNRNFKLSMKLLTSAISKEGNQPILMVLKALALQRSGHEIEGLALADEVKAGKPTEHAVLSTLRLVYKAAGKSAEIVELYENAILAGFNNEDMQLSLFWSYARANAFEKMQQLSMRLFTKTNKSEYLFWSSTCSLLQFPSGSNGMFLIARKLIERHAYPMTMEPEHLLVLVRVLTRLGELDAAVTLITGPKGAKFRENAGERARWLAALYEDQGRFADIASLHREMLEGPTGDPDDWLNLTGYLKYSFRAGVSPTKVSELRDFLERLQRQELARPRPRRGPFLAELELEYHLQAEARAGDAQGQSDPSAALHESAERVVGMLVLYYERFGTKLAFFNDVKKYLALLPALRVGDSSVLQPVVPHLTSTSVPLARADKNELGRRVEAVLSTIDASGSESSGGSPQTWSCALGDEKINPRSRLCGAMFAAARAISPKDANDTKELTRKTQMLSALYQVVRHCGLDEALSTADLTAIAQSLFDQFLGSISLDVDAKLEATERGCGDGFLLLCAHALFSLFERTQERRFLIDAVLALELGLGKYSRHNFQFALSLVRLLCHPLVGAAHRALAVFKKLDIKQIQLDSLSHLISGDLLRYGLFDEAGALVDAVRKFHETHRNEHADLTSQAWKAGNYSKVLEFTAFRDRLASSFTLAVAHADAAIKAVATLDVPSDVLTLAALALEDKLAERAGAGEVKEYALNHDYSLVSCWEPAGSVMSAQLNRPAPSLFLDSFLVPGGRGVEEQAVRVGAQCEARGLFRLDAAQLDSLNARQTNNPTTPNYTHRLNKARRIGRFASRAHGQTSLVEVQFFAVMLICNSYLNILLGAS
jgi:hypothetical protein